MLRSIQVLRALAATSVVVLHADQTKVLNGAAEIGAAGVDLFFVISGFIMATVATDRSPGCFLADRVWRIFPLWFVALSPWLLAQQHDWQTILTSLTLWPVWGDGFSMPALGIGWSLCFEMLFYAAFAFALATRAAIPLTAFAASLGLASFTSSALFGYLGSPLILEFLAGVVIARLPFREGLGLPLLLAGLAWLAISPIGYGHIVYGDLAFIRVAAWGIPAALIVYSSRCLERRFDRRFEFPVQLGHASYAIYLFHPLIAELAIGLLPTIALSLAVGLLAHFAIERPMMRLRRESRSTGRDVAKLSAITN